MSHSEVLPGGGRLIDRLRIEAARPNVRRIRLALGYLFLPGMQPVWNAFEDSAATEIQLLIGNTAGILTDEQRVAAVAHASSLSAGPIMAPEHDLAAGPRADRDAIIGETAQSLRENLRHFAQHTENERFVVSLASAIGTNRLRVRIYPDGRLHTKASVFEHEPPMDCLGCYDSVALVGSSNLTLPSSGNPTEMNVLLRDPEQVTAVGAWFDALWDASQDFTRALFLELTERAHRDDSRLPTS